MLRLTSFFRTIALTVAVVAMAFGAAAPASSADMPSSQQMSAEHASLSSADYLDRYAELLLLRQRFNAVLDTEMPDMMRAAAERSGPNGPSAVDVQALREDLTSELYYYVVNLKYLIWADGAIWPEDKPAADYRRDALAELSKITEILASGDVLWLDTNDLLHRLESVNARTEGVDQPVEDAFDPRLRAQLVEDALKQD